MPEDSDKSDSGRSVSDQVLTSTLWMGGWRWTARLIGFVNTIIIARLLLPDDFGIAATALLVVGFFDIMIDLGTDKYLIRLSEPRREDYDTAWTLRLLVVSLSAGVIFFGAETAADLFGDDRLVDVLHVLAGASLLRGFSNIGLTMYRRELQYSRIALIGLGQRMAGFTTTVVLAVILRDYWAVVLGEVALRVAELVLSYVFHPYRPRVSLVELGKQWRFCKWIVVRNIAVFLQGGGDSLIVAKVFGMEKMGLYAMAVRFAQLPTKHLMAPVLMPVYSGLAKKQGDAEVFARSILQVIGGTCAVSLPAATLFATLSEQFVGAVLGVNWTPSVPLVAPMVFAIVAAVLADPAVTALTLAGRVRLLAVLHWFSGITLVALMLWVAQRADLELFAEVRALLGLGMMLLYYHWMCRVLTLPWRRVFACVYRPGVATLVMAAVTIAIGEAGMGAWGTIVVGTLLGGMTYLAVLYGLWRISGDASAGEALLIRKAGMVAGRVVARLHR